jgi:hypothetical protein
MKMYEVGGACSNVGKMMDAYSVVVGKFMRKRKLGRPRHM